ncbi:MAG: hypothetical protein ACUZ8E_17815 [Candidatus Anammoxibacter sp.]
MNKKLKAQTAIAMVMALMMEPPGGHLQGGDTPIGNPEKDRSPKQIENQSKRSKRYKKRKAQRKAKATTKRHKK